MIIKKAAELDPARSLQFAKELSLSGWELTNALRGYVQSVGGEGNWMKVVNDLTLFEGRQDNEGRSTGLSPSIRSMIASQWVRDDFDQGIEWFTGGTSPDFSDLEKTKELTSLLVNVLPDDRGRVVNWIETQLELPTWDDQFLLNYGGTLVRNSPDESIHRMVALVSNEEDRFTFVKGFVGSGNPSSKIKLRHAPWELNRLIEIANLSPRHSSTLREVVAAGTWNPN